MHPGLSHVDATTGYSMHEAPPAVRLSDQASGMEDEPVHVHHHPKSSISPMASRHHEELAAFSQLHLAPGPPDQVNIQMTDSRSTSEHPEAGPFQQMWEHVSRTAAGDRATLHGHPPTDHSSHRQQMPNPKLQLEEHPQLLRATAEDRRPGRAVPEWPDSGRNKAATQRVLQLTRATVQPTVEQPVIGSAGLLFVDRLRYHKRHHRVFVSRSVPRAANSRQLDAGTAAGTLLRDGEDDQQADSFVEIQPADLQSRREAARREQTIDSGADVSGAYQHAVEKVSKAYESAKQPPDLYEEVELVNRHPHRMARRKEKEVASPEAPDSAAIHQHVLSSLAQQQEEQDETFEEVQLVDR